MSTCSALSRPLRIVDNVRCMSIRFRPRFYILENNKQPNKSWIMHARGRWDRIRAPNGSHLARSLFSFFGIPPSVLRGKKKISKKCWWASEAFPLRFFVASARHSKQTTTLLFAMIIHLHVAVMSVRRVCRVEDVLKLKGSVMSIARDKMLCAMESEEEEHKSYEKLKIVLIV